VNEFEYGWYINVPYTLDSIKDEEEGILRGYPFSEAFIKLLQFTEDLECTILVLDRDGPEYDYLEKFDW